MKKRFQYILCFSFIFILLGCSGNKIEKQSEKIIKHIQNNEFTEVINLGNDDLKSHFSAEQLESMWQQTNEGLGKYVKIEEHIIDESNQQTTDLVVVNYQNGTLRFTLTYDSNQKLSNIYIK